MPYARIETSALRHPKIRRLSDGAFRLWVAALAYAQDGLTDGLLVDLTSSALGCKVTKKRIKEIKNAALWDPEGDHFRIHNYDLWNNLKSEVEHRRQLARTRYARWRSSHTRDVDAPDTNASTDASTGALADALPTRVQTLPARSLSSLRDPNSGSDNGRGTGEPTPKPAPTRAFWDDFQAIGKAHGYDHRLPETPKEYGHLVQLTGAYTPDELHTMAAAFWASPYLPADRNLGLFAFRAGAIFKHVRDGARTPFGAPPDVKKATGATSAPAAFGAWGPPPACPHAPPCETARACETLTALNRAQGLPDRARV